jgi:putative pyrroloquinoline-quinone binding quinoprotein
MPNRRLSLSLAIAAGLLICCVQPALCGTFRRTLFEHTVALGEEAPSVAVEGRTAVFADGANIKFVDLSTGKVKKTVPVKPAGAKGKGLAWTKILGIVDGRVYACIRHFSYPEGHAKPGGKWARVGGGVEPGSYQFVEVTAGGTATVILKLPPDAQVADRLLEKNLVYVRRGALHVIPLDGKSEQKFKLKNRPIWRPQVRGKDLIGRCDGSVYFYRAGDAAPKEIPCRGTGLDILIGASIRWVSVERTRDSIIVAAQKYVACCDLDGKLRWKLRRRGHIAIGPKEEILLIGLSVLDGRGSIMRLAAKDGKVVWRRCLAPIGIYAGGGANRPGAVQVVGGRLVIASSGGTGHLVVLDPAEGKVLMDMPQRGKSLKRKSYRDGIPLTHMAAAGNYLAVGFETWVSGVDITPTAKVPAADQASDPANAASQVRAFYKKSGAGANPDYRSLIKWGTNMADTPEAAGLIAKPLKALLGRLRGSTSTSLAASFCWMNDPMIPQAMSRFIKEARFRDRNRGTAMVNMLACHPDRKAALAAIKNILANPKSYPSKIREKAALQLDILEGPKAAPPADDLKLLYGTDHTRTIEVFRKKLRAADKAGKLKILETIKVASEEVLIGLGEDLITLPGGAKMVQEARGRKNILDRLPKK